MSAEEGDMPTATAVRELLGNHKKLKGLISRLRKVKAARVNKTSSFEYDVMNEAAKEKLAYHEKADLKGFRNFKKS